MAILYFDCSAGAAGDMILAALLDCGIPLQNLKDALALLPIGKGYRMETQRVIKKGLGALQLKITVTEKQPPRRLPEILQLISRSKLSTAVKEKSFAAFQTLARAEAKVHGISCEEVHFHEIGAMDSILDIVGSMVSLEMLAVERIYASPLPLGSGFIHTSHGRIPLPAPATMEILCTHRIPCYGLSLEGETVTPTGAAILSTVCTDFSPHPCMIVEKIGYGAGFKDYGHPNILRVFKGTKATWQEADYLSTNSPLKGSLLAEPLEMMEANVDDLNPEIYDYVLERLFAEGALDVYFTPIQMKKNRPAVKINVLAKPQHSYRLGQILLRETTTLGYRRQIVEKIMLPREHRLVKTPWGNVRVKVAGQAPDYYNIAPEYEDCLHIARQKGIPLKEVYQSVWSLLHKVPDT